MISNNPNHEYMKLKRFATHYKKTKKRNCLRDYIMLNGGLDGIKEKFGDIGLFLKYCSPEYHDIFSRQHLQAFKKELQEIKGLLQVNEK